MKIDPDAPAHPTIELYDIDPNDVQHPGMTIRTQIAAMAMQGMLANKDLRNDIDNLEVARCSAGYADALIAELNKTA